jgi:PKD domain
MKTIVRSLCVLALAALGVTAPAPAQVGCGAQGVQTAEYPPWSNYQNALHLPSLVGASDPQALYAATSFGVVRWDLSSPAAPSPHLFEIGTKNPNGRAPIQVPGDVWQGPSTMGAWESSDGSGAIVTDWLFNNGNSVGNAMIVKMAAGGGLSFGQQAEPDGMVGDSVGYGYPITVVRTSAGRLFAYFASHISSNPYVFAAEITTTTGSADSPPIAATRTATSWTRVLSLVHASIAGSPYLFTVNPGSPPTLAAAAVGGDGSLSVTASTSLVSTGALVVRVVNADFWLFMTRSDGGISIYSYRPGDTSFGTVGTIPTPSASSYADIRVQGGQSPVILALKRSSIGLIGYDLIGVSASGVGTVAASLPYDPLNIGLGWEFYVPQPAAGSGYLYYSVPGTNAQGDQQLRTQAISIGCVTQSGPPVSSLTVVNASPHYASDSNDYLGDTFTVTDTSVSGQAIINRYWKLSCGAPCSFPTGDAGDAALRNLGSFSTLLPCDLSLPGADHSTGNNCYVVASPPTSQTVANRDSNASGEATSPGTKLKNLVLPQTKVRNLSGGVVQILSGGSIDASISQGSPVFNQYSWRLPLGCATVTVATCSAVQDGDSFAVQAKYPGDYVAPEVSGTVRVVSLIPGFTVPSGSYLWSSTGNPQYIANVVNGTLKGTTVTIYGIGYAIDVNSTNTSGPFTPVTFDANNKASLQTPSGTGTHAEFVHFQVTYTDSSSTQCAAGPCYADWDSQAITLTDVQYTPTILISPSVFCQSTCAATQNTPYTFRDSGDTAKPVVSAQWSATDGWSATGDTSSTGGVTHTFTTTGNKTLTLVVSGVSASLVLNVQAPIGDGCTLTASGSTSLSPGASGNWSATPRSCSAGTISWISSDGGSGTGASWTHVFATAGSYTVHATLNGTSSNSVSVSVSTGPPPGNLAVTVAGSATVNQNTPGSWTATVTGVSSYSISWFTSESPTFPSGSTTTLNYTFGTAGAQWVKAVVSSGQQTATKQYAVSVGGGPTLPSTVFTLTGVSYDFGGGANAAVGDVIGFHGSETSATATFTWAFSDGAAATGKDATHVFLAPGAASVRLTVFDSASNLSATSSPTTIHLTGQAFTALVVPGSGWIAKTDPNSQAVLGHYETELSLYNNSASSVNVDFDFEPDGSPIGDPSTITFDATKRVVLAPKSNWFSADVVNGYLGKQGTGNLYLKYSGNTATPSAVARIYYAPATGSTGTFGTYLPAYAINATGPVLNDVATQTQHIVGLRNDSGFYSNLTVVAASPSAGTFNVVLWRDDGIGANGSAGPVGTKSLQLGGYQEARLNMAADIFPSGYAPDPAHAYYANVTSTASPALPVFAVASVIDNRTKDSVLITDDTPRQTTAGGNAEKFFMAGVGRILGASANWKTDLDILNNGTVPALLQFYYHHTDGGIQLTSSTTLITLGAGQQLGIRDVITSLFSDIPAAASVVGDLEIDYRSGADTQAFPPIIQGKIYNDQPAGTFGMQLPVFSADTHGIYTPTSGKIIIAGLRNDASSSSKFGFTGMGLYGQAIVHADAYDSTGTRVWQSDYTVGNTLPNFLLQPTDGIAELADKTFTVVLSVTGGDGSLPVAGFGTVIDRASSDPIYIPGKKVQ